MSADARIELLRVFALTVRASCQTAPRLCTLNRTYHLLLIVRYSTVLVAMNVLLGAKKIVIRKAAKSLKVLFTSHLQKMRVEAKIIPR